MAAIAVAAAGCSGNDGEPDPSVVDAAGKTPTHGPTRTVADLIGGKVSDDEAVRLRGRATRKIDEDEYTFKDSTGTIRMDLEDEAPAMKLPLNVRITVDGVYDRGDREVDVTMWHRTG
ncbi:MAG: NirD/YgiW/YdeI family stress tolerance protein [Actinopolymorphaceae bacterium]